MNIPTNLLRAVALASGRKDIRYYLNGVRVVREGRLVTLVATDGNRMHVGAFSCGGRADQHYEVTLPIDAVRAALDTKDIVVGFPPSFFQPGLRGGQYPDWKRVTAVADRNTPGPFDADHIGDVLKAARLLVKRRPMLETRGSVFTVASVDNFYAILLTRRQ